MMHEMDNLVTWVEEVVALSTHHLSMVDGDCARRNGSCWQRKTLQ